MQYVIDGEHDGRKVVHFLRGRLRFSARLVAKLKTLPEGILLNGAHTRTIDRLHTGDVLTVNLPEEVMRLEPLEYALDVVFEDEDLLIINKPAGLAMHPTHNHQGDTLANAVSAYFAQKGAAHAFRSIGRLDKGTSGLVVCALNKYAASRLTGHIEKSYLALPGGHYEGSGTIDTPIVRPDPMKTLRWVGEGGEHAVTHWRAKQSGEQASLLEVCLETGRTHQIRVHFASLGTPLLGDDMYGGTTDLIARPALHCASLRFLHPVSEKEMCFAALMPEDMCRIASLCAK
jgi:23S rRNA pseudouridine1911/1915/1917 synthase